MSQYLTKGNLIATGLGLGGGILGTMFFTRWLPQYQENAARKQGEILAEQLAQRMGMQYPMQPGVGQQPGSMDAYSLLRDLRNDMNVLKTRMDDMQRELRDYKGADK